MTSIACDYVGVRLRSPVIASSSPLTADDGLVAQLDHAGVGAVVLPSVFEEQLDPTTSPVRRSELAMHNGGPDALLRRVERLATTRETPVVVRLDVTGPGPWAAWAGHIASAGAVAVELGVTPVPRAFDVGPAEIEDIVVDAAAAVVASTTLPVVVKLTTVPALGHLALRLVDAGVRGLVLFGRTPVPDLDVETGRPVPVLPLSGPDELLSPLRWTAVLAGRLDVTIVTAGGVHRGTDLVKAVLAGADAVAVTSCLLRYGPAHVAVLRDGLARWLSSHGLDDVAQVRGRDCLAAGEDAGTVARARSTTTLVAATGELADRASMRAGSSVW